MYNILFVEKKLRTDKLGIMYLSRILKDDGNSVNLLQDDIDNIDSYLQSNKVDYIMYSVCTGEHKWFIDKNTELKKNYPYIISIMGGPHFTFFPEQGLSDQSIDYVVTGHGEDVILNIIDKKITTKLVEGHPIENINNLQSPDRDIQYKYDEFGKSPMKRFIACRDCLNSCKYCFNHLYHKIYKNYKDRFFQITSPNKIIKEIKDVKDKYGLELAYFNDDNLALNHEWLFEFCNKFKKQLYNPYNIKFCGSIRADTVTPEIIKTMSESGCVFLNIAVESSNPKTQKFLRRGNITNEQIITACKLCQELGIKIRLQNMIGLPVENPLQDALETLEFNISINPTDSWASIFQPFPKTDIHTCCIEKNLIDKDTECMNFYEDTRLNIKDAEKINALHKWWFFIVKYQIPTNFVNILLEIPLTQEQKTKLQNMRWDIASKLLYGI